MAASAQWTGHTACASLVPQNDITVHIGQWRTWKESKLLGGQIPEGYDKEAKGLISSYFKQRPAGSGLPWSTQGVLDLKKKKIVRPAEKGARDPKDKEGPEDERTSKVAKITELEKQLRDLKRNLKQENEAAGRKKRKSQRSRKETTKMEAL